jgi:hypothetical protein
MINKFVKYFFVFTILFIFTITSIIALDSDLRRYLFGRAISAYKLYQIIAIQPYLKSDNIEGASTQLLKYIKTSEKFANGKSILLLGIYDVAKLVEIKASSKEDYFHLEKVFKKLVEQDPSLYEAQVWLAKSYSYKDTALALKHIDKAIEISSAQDIAYRVAIKIAQNNDDKNLASFYCNKYKNSKFGGSLPRYTKSFFEGNIITKMALEFLPEQNSQNFYTHSGLQLNSFDNYEFTPIKPLDIDGFKIYLSFLPGIRIDLSEILIIDSNNSKLIPIHEISATSRSAYIDNNTQDTLSFLIMNESDEVLNIKFKNKIKSLNKILLKMKISKLNLTNNFLCN